MRNSIFIVLFAASWGCSMKTVALRTTVKLLEQGVPATQEEADWRLAKDAMPAQIAMVEGLLRSAPHDQNLLRLAAQGLGGYAFLFIEDENPRRARELYRRGRDRGLALLSRREAWAKLAELPLDAFEAALKEAERADAPDLFWTALNWANFINLSKDSAAAVAELPKAVALMRRVLELDADYNFAGADLFFGVYYASRPAILGGDIKKSQAHFQEARRRTGGKYLMNYVLEARYAAVAAQDPELFRGLLTKVAEAKAGELPNARLTDETAKVKAKSLLERIDELF